MLCLKSFIQNLDYYVYSNTSHIFQTSVLFETYLSKACSNYVLFLITITIIIIVSMISWHMAILPLFCSGIY